MSLPKPTQINPALHKKLLEADAAIKAVNQLTQMFQANAQARLQAAQAEARAAWEAIGRETGVNLQSISWEPHPTDPVIVPTGMRL
jgi:hypothetical protein